MKFINKLSQNKVKLLFALIVVLSIVLVISTIIFFTDNSQNPGYGSRLDGIKEVEIEKSQLEKMTTTMEKEKTVKTVSHNIQGKIVNVIIEVEKDTKLKDAQSLAKKVTDCFEKDQIGYYDFQIFIKNEDTKNASYPIIGYKKATSSNFSFTKNRGEK